MKPIHTVVTVIAFAAGVVAGLAAAAASKTDPSVYSGKSPKEAALALLAVAQAQAGKGSWENIGVGRIHYLMGHKSEGQAIFDRIAAGKVKKDDWLRIGRVYVEAKDRDKARAAFDRALALGPKDAEYAAEIGAYYNLQGDRGKAEELFARSFQLSSDYVWNTLNAAGSYVGVRPQ